MKRTLWLTAAAALSAHASVGAQQHEHEKAEKLGSVHFATSCNAEAQPHFDRAVSLLHSFQIPQAIEGFGLALKADPSCAIADWGIALSRWGNPMAAGNKSVRQMQLARVALDSGGAIGPRTERERGYLSAVAKLYADYEHTPQLTRVTAYRDAMGELSAKFPRDTEAKIFYALSLTAASPPTDKSYAGQLKAAAILEPLFKAQPDHPGLAHYLIHTYDVPPLASRALVAAERYSRIAPSAGHALHMPSHTFTRVGLWQASIDGNIASSASARSGNDAGGLLHSSDYMMYAYLQTAQDAAAHNILDSLPAITSRFEVTSVTGAAPGAAGVYALAAIPARYALERGAWAEAAKLEPRMSSLPYTEAMTYFARAIGASHTGEIAIVKSAIDSLQPLRDRLEKAGEPYWAEQVRIQSLAASALLLYVQGDAPAAITAMRAAADAEDRTEKSAVTPGPLAPARELLAEMLLQTQDPKRALVEFKAVLVNDPNRFRALYGAAQAAKLSGDKASAKRYLAQLQKSCVRADTPGRAELRVIRATP